MESFFTFFSLEAAFLNFLIVLIFVICWIFQRGAYFLIEILEEIEEYPFIVILTYLYILWGIYNLISFIYQL